LFVNQSSEASLGASDTFTLSYVDKAVELAKVGNNDTDSGALPIRPLRMGGADHWAMFLHPYQVTDLRTSTSTGQWLDIQKAAMQGGKVADNPIFTGALGMYNNVILHEASRIPSVTANTKRAVLCGAQAACMGFGKSNSPGRMTWVEELFDYKNQLGVSAGCIAGMKKSVYNSIDFGTIVVSSYAVKHT
jgi:N4-gp56 family major capsid protein